MLVAVLRFVFWFWVHAARCLWFLVGFGLVDVVMIIVLGRLG